MGLLLLLVEETGGVAVGLSDGASVVGLFVCATDGSADDRAVGRRDSSTGASTVGNDVASTGEGESMNGDVVGTSGHAWRGFALGLNDGGFEEGSADGYSVMGGGTAVVTDAFAALDPSAVLALQLGTVATVAATIPTAAAATIP